MANDFMRNANKVSLDGEVVSFSNTLPFVDVKEDVVDTKDEEEVVVETEDEEITESAEETTDEEIADEE